MIQNPNKILKIRIKKCKILKIRIKKCTNKIAKPYSTENK